jgi:hypothetical protein
MASRQFVSGSIISLSVVFHDQIGNLVDTDGAVITIVGPGNQTLLVNQSLFRENLGLYTYLWQTPLNLPIGYYQELYEGFYQGQIKKIHGQFEVVAADAFDRPATPATREGQMLQILRDSLSDNAPNIRAKQWSDGELFNFLQLALMDVNSMPAITVFSLANFPDNWSGVVVEGAIAAALRAMLLELGKTDIDFNDNGISVSIARRVDTMLALYNDAVQRFTTQAAALKKNFRPRGMNIISGSTSMNLRSLRMSQLLSIVNQR